MNSHVRSSRRAACILSAIALASCGGGNSTDPDDKTAAVQASNAVASRKSIQSFEPPSAIPADANVKGMWSPVYAWPVIAVHSVLTPDGRLMTYGSDLTGAQTGHSVYDIWDSTGAPDAGHMTLPNGTGTDLFCSSQLVLPTSGNVFIAGGDIWNGSSTTSASNNNSNLVDLTSKTLTRGIDMQRQRWYSSSTTLLNGETYVQGGNGGNDHPEIRGVDGKFRLMTGIDTSAFAFQFPRNFIAPDGRLFGYSTDGQMYFVDTTGAGSAVAAGRFDAGDWFATTAMYRPGHILQMGGNSNRANKIDITGGKAVVTPTQSMATVRAWANATILPDGKVVATSGSAVANESTGFNNTAETWDPTTEQWSVGAAASKMRLYHSNAILLPDASVLTSGGGAISNGAASTDPNKNNLNAEVYYPPYLFTAAGTRAVRPQIDKAPAWIDIGQSFGVDLSTSVNVSRVTLVKTGSVSHSFNFEQRFLELTFKTIGQHVAVQAPTHAGEAPPGYYMLFVFDAAGVPSIGKVVRMGVATDPNPLVTPVIVAPAAHAGTIGAAASLQLSATDPNGDALEFTAAGLPAGLAIDAATGRIAGTPMAAGNFIVVVTVSDGVNAASTTFAWTVQAAMPLDLKTPATPPFLLAANFAKYTADASGGSNLRYQWDFGDGTASAWTDLPNIRHAYATAGVFIVTLNVTDDSKTVRSRSFTQVVYLAATDNRPAASGNLLSEKAAGGRERIWVVNQDNDSVSIFDAKTFDKLGEINVGAAPRAIAMSHGGAIWVTNKQGASISVIDSTTGVISKTIALPRGSQPFGIVMSPVGNSAYVVLEADGHVLRFDTSTYQQTGSAAVGSNARHVSITADGTKLYVSRYITAPLPGESTAKVAPTPATGGEVLQFDANALTLQRTIVLEIGTKVDTETQGRGIPNYLGAAVISPDGTQAWVPSKQDNVQRGTLRDGLNLSFQNTVRAVSSHIRIADGVEDTNARIDHDNAGLASAAVFEPHGVYMFVALETSREVAVINAFSGAQLFRVDVGRSPEGLAISVDGRSLYVNNFMDRSVGVYDLAPLLDQGAMTLPSIATMRAVGTEKLAPSVLLGKQLFYDARDPRLARDRYMSCASCHNDGGHDGRVWDLTGLGEGLRNTIALRGHGGMSQGFLHWSNNFDEVQDFEGQIRTLAGGSGLMTDAAFATGTRSASLGDRKAGLSSDLDALAAYLASLNTFDAAPARPSADALSANALAGKAVFTATNCASCHSGASFTGSGENTLVDIGTLKPSSGKRINGPLTGIDVPTLRDVWATAPYLHDGSAPTLDIAIRAHKSISFADGDVAKLAAYLREIGVDEPPAMPTAGKGAGLTGAYFNNTTLSGDAALTRTEAVDFDWGNSAPASSIRPDNFSVRWKGKLTAPSTGTYRFQTDSDDGVRLWVGGTSMIDHWDVHSVATDTSAGMNLVAGQSVDIVMEYVEYAGLAVAKLRWLTPGDRAYVIVPASALTSAVAVAAPKAGSGLSASYFNNTALSGAPALTRTEAVDFDWGAGSPSPVIQADNFSARWTGSVLIPTSGYYVFRTIGDDGMRLWLGGMPVVDDWAVHPPQIDDSRSLFYNAGTRVPVRLEYFEAGGGAVARLQWITPGSTAAVPIPATALLPN